MPTFLKNRRLESGSSGVVLPTGPSTERPSYPVFGLIRYNTDTASVEYFDGTQFVTMAVTGGITYNVDNFTGDGITTVFVMSIAESVATQVIVFVGSIYQDPATAYTVNGSLNITFTSAPGSGIPISVIHSTS